MTYPATVIPTREPESRMPRPAKFAWIPAFAGMTAGDWATVRLLRAAALNELELVSSLRAVIGEAISWKLRPRVREQGL